MPRVTARTALLAGLGLLLALTAGCGSAGPAANTASASSSALTSRAAETSRSSGSSETSETSGTSGAPTGATAPEPYVEGNRLVDARTGATWVPRGVNWSSFEYACAQGWAYSALDTLGADGATQQAEALAGWHVDTVRLPLNEDCWLGTRGAPVSDATQRTAAGYRAAVVGFVQALRARGIVTILDLQSRKRADSPQFGNVAMPDSDSVSFWTSVASTFRDDPSLMFDAFSEPYSRYDAAGKLVFDLGWGCWRDGGCTPPAVDDQTAVGTQTYPAVGMSTLVHAIRASGAQQPIMLGGLDYANDLSGWLAHAPQDSQLVAAVHLYDFKPCLAACWSSTLLPLAHRVPVLAAELGAKDPSSGFVASYLRFADVHGLGALFWVWGNNPSDPMSLTSGLTEGPTAYGLLARAWLAREPTGEWPKG